MARALPGYVATAGMAAGANGRQKFCASPLSLGSAPEAKSPLL
eukprot:CAMPEP_0180524416 /NCGR_PEP_ID=MMETSP1036_2-20121128/58615_1 /TAXON_ID=632150 /ORGANISM="Azadinium spinosum, Strain 3D9" /LENGTH=42 /DNA_ID= /DNA_START= /DNA_END= /DNA_ORIENTATION=